MRIGHGFDVHRFGAPASEQEIVVGGVTIEHSARIIAHSDGDVLLHAISDALLGAAGLGDIGHHFPDTDPAYKNADSRHLLRIVMDEIRKKNLNISNIDSTIVVQAPKMAPHLEEMKANLAADCDLSIDRINIKATTTERLGYTGSGEGIAAHAVVLLTEQND